MAGLICFLAGLFFSKAILSISLGMIFMQPFLVYSIKDVFKKLLANRISLLFVIFYLIVLLSYFNTENKHEYLKDIILKLPLLAIPFGLLYDELYSRRNYLILFMVLNSLVCLVGMGTLANYLMHFNEINKEILHSKPIPVFPGDKLGHIYFGFIQAYAILSGFFLYIKKTLAERWRKYNIIITGLSFILIHIIGSRTGLAAFYLSILFLLAAWGITERRYLLTICLFLFFFMTAFFSVSYIPSLQNRYQNTVKDIRQYVNGNDLNYYSISMRVMAWKKTVDIIHDHPWIGVGYGDVLPEIKSRFREEGSALLEENQKEPHNQFLEVFAATGIFGFLFFLFIFFYPLKRIFKYKDLKLLGLIVIMFASFNIESALEMQRGVCYFTLMWIYLNNLPIENEIQLHL